MNGDKFAINLSIHEVFFIIINGGPTDFTQIAKKAYLLCLFGAKRY